MILFKARQKFLIAIFLLSILPNLYSKENVKVSHEQFLNEGCQVIFIEQHENDLLIPVRNPCELHILSTAGGVVPASCFQGLSESVTPIVSCDGKYFSEVSYTSNLGVDGSEKFVWVNTKKNIPETVLKRENSFESIDTNVFLKTYSGYKKNCWMKNYVENLIHKSEIKIDLNDFKISAVKNQLKLINNESSEIDSKVIGSTLYCKKDNTKIASKIGVVSDNGTIMHYLDLMTLTNYLGLTKEGESNLKIRNDLFVLRKNIERCINNLELMKPSLTDIAVKNLEDLSNNYSDLLKEIEISGDDEHKKVTEKKNADKNIEEAKQRLNAMLEDCLYLEDINIDQKISNIKEEGIKKWRARGFKFYVKSIATNTLSNYLDGANFFASMITGEKVPKVAIDLVTDMVVNLAKDNAALADIFQGKELEQFVRTSVEKHIPKYGLVRKQTELGRLIRRDFLTYSATYYLKENISDEEEKKNIEQYSQAILADFDKCTEKVKDDETLDKCLNISVDGLPLKIGATIMRSNLLSNFSPLFKSGESGTEFKLLQERAMIGYKVCAQNWIAKTPTDMKQGDKITPCVYEGILEAYKTTTEQKIKTIIKKTFADQGILNQEIVDGVSDSAMKYRVDCKHGRMFEKSLAFLFNDYKNLLKMDTPTFTKELISCGDAIALNAGKEIVVTIVKNLDLLKDVPGLNADQVAEKIIKKDYKNCMSHQKDPELCTQLVRNRVAQEIVNASVKDKLDEYIKDVEKRNASKAGFDRIQNVCISKVEEENNLILENAGKQVSALDLVNNYKIVKKEKEQITKDSLELLKNVEFKMLECFENGIWFVIESVTPIVIKDTINSNKEIAKHNINLSDEDMEIYKTTMSGCVEKELKKVEKYEELKERVDRGLNDCRFILTKKITKNVVPTVIRSSLEKYVDSERNTAGPSVGKEFDINNFINRYMNDGEHALNVRLDKTKDLTQVEKLQNIIYSEVLTKDELLNYIIDQKLYSLPIDNDSRRKVKTISINNLKACVKSSSEKYLAITDVFSENFSNEVDLCLAKMVLDISGTIADQISVMLNPVLKNSLASKQYDREKSAFKSCLNRDFKAFWKDTPSVELICDGSCTALRRTLQKECTVKDGCSYSDIMMGRIDICSEKFQAKIQELVINVLGERIDGGKDNGYGGGPVGLIGESVNINKDVADELKILMNNTQGKSDVDMQGTPLDITSLMAQVDSLKQMSVDLCNYSKNCLIEIKATNIDLRHAKQKKPNITSKELMSVIYKSDFVKGVVKASIANVLKEKLYAALKNDLDKNGIMKKNIETIASNVFIEKLFSSDFGKKTINEIMKKIVAYDGNVEKVKADKAIEGSVIMLLLNDTYDFSFVDYLADGLITPKMHEYYDSNNEFLTVAHWLTLKGKFDKKNFTWSFVRKNAKNQANSIREYIIATALRPLLVPVNGSVKKELSPQERKNMTQKIESEIKSAILYN